ncbi:MAG: peptidase M61, partial [Cyclobacteriaceae bacterium]
MKIRILVIAFLVLAVRLSAQQVNKVTIDLINVSEDKVDVTYTPPSPSGNQAEFQIPKIVPGTYSISDFGRFVNDFTALSETGDTLEVEKLSENRWRIDNAKQLATITYRVDDTYDTDKSNVIFEPGGTNIDAANDLFTINTFGFIGYLKEFEKTPYEVTVKHKEGLYGATSMKGEKIDETTDKFTAPNYFELADAPILYSIPDTTSMQIGGAEILVSVYSPNKKLNAKEVMGNVKEILTAQKDYLGGNLPIDKYAFLIYLFPGQTKSGAYGALEHSYSSLYILPEAGIDRIGSIVNDVAAHEFFHIVTPLNIHAEQIGNFDFIEPEMSKHLWLYEGVTEYSAQHVQVKYGLISVEEFLNEMRIKMFSATRYNRDLPFTEMSANVLKPEYEDQYANVYEKGALIGMCLDLLLLKESEGDYNLQQLMQDLSKE